jgi:hypothetical protein
MAIKKVKPLSQTNPHLKNKKKRDKLIQRSVDTSGGVEGIKPKTLKYKLLQDLIKEAFDRESKKELNKNSILSVPYSKGFKILKKRLEPIKDKVSSDMLNNAFESSIEKQPVHEVLIWEKIRTFAVVIVIILQTLQFSHFMGWL